MSWKHKWTFMELPVPPMYHVDGTLTRDDFAWQVRKGPDGPRDEPPPARVACPDCTALGVKPVHQSTLLLDMIDVTTDICTTCNGQGELVDWTGCDVRVRAKYPASERIVHDDTKAVLKKRFPNARICDVELVAVQTHQLRAPEVVAATTLEEKLQAMARLDGSPWAGEVEQCATLLLSTEDGDAVLAQVRAELEPLAQLQEQQ